VLCDFNPIYARNESALRKGMRNSLCPPLDKVGGQDLPFMRKS